MNLMLIWKLGPERVKGQKFAEFRFGCVLYLKIKQPLPRNKTLEILYYLEKENHFVKYKHMNPKFVWQS